jgi:hypothetical protein
LDGVWDEVKPDDDPRPNKDFRDVNQGKKYECDIKMEKDPVMLLLLKICLSEALKAHHDMV